MRRILCVTLAAGILLVGCSSSKKSSTPASSSSTASSVAVSAENAAFCADLQAFYDQSAKSAKVLAKASPADRPAQIKVYFVAIKPATEKAKASAPPEVADNLGAFKSAIDEAAALNPAVKADQDKLDAMLISNDSLLQAGKSLAAYAKTNCGITNTGV
jgi:outer membrane protein TolC